MIAITNGAVGGVGVLQRQDHDVLLLGFFRGLDLLAVTAHKVHVFGRAAHQHHAFVGQGAPAEALVQQADIGQRLLQVIDRFRRHFDARRGLLAGRADVQGFVVDEPLEVMLLTQPVEEFLRVLRTNAPVQRARNRRHVQADAELLGEVCQRSRQLRLPRVVGVGGVFPGVRHRGQRWRSDADHQQRQPH